MSRTLDLADQLLGGQLRESVIAWRTEGLSFFDIAVRLKAEHSVSVSPDTVRRWTNQAGFSSPAEAAS